jgi:hypothetical protein
LSSIYCFLRMVLPLANFSISNNIKY